MASTTTQSRNEHTSHRGVARFASEILRQVRYQIRYMRRHRLTREEIHARHAAAAADPDVDRALRKLLAERPQYRSRPD